MHNKTNFALHCGLSACFIKYTYAVLLSQLLLLTVVKILFFFWEHKREVIKLNILCTPFSSASKVIKNSWKSFWCCCISWQISLLDIIISSVATACFECDVRSTVKVLRRKKMLPWNLCPTVRSLYWFYFTREKVSNILVPCIFIYTYNIKLNVIY